MAYAEHTDVPVNKTRADIEKVLTKYGAKRFAYMGEERRADDEEERMSETMEEVSDERAFLTDDEISNLIEDPAKIETHEVALEVIAVLDAEIASIQVQVDAATIEANIRPLSDERQAWLRRASYAGAMRRNERHKVMQRDREIRRVKGIAQMEPRRSKEEKLLRQQRLLIEAETRREQKRAEGLRRSNLQAELSQKRKEIEAARSFERRFLAAAKRILPPELFKQINTEATAQPTPPTPPAPPVQPQENTRSTL